MATISDFSLIRPDFELDQKDSVQWLAAIHAEAAKAPDRHGEFLGLLSKIGLGEQKIQKRGGLAGGLLPSGLGSNGGLSRPH